LIARSDHEVAGQIGLLRETAHIGNRRLDQILGGALRHAQREQAVREHVAGAGFRHLHITAELEHLDHPEQLTDRAIELRRDLHHRQGLAARCQQFQDVQTLLQSGRTIPAVVVVRPLGRRGKLRDRHFGHLLSGGVRQKILLAGGANEGLRNRVGQYGDGPARMLKIAGGN
jgi:hypothetical protein